MIDIKNLKNIFKGDISLDEKTLDVYSTDASIFKITPQAVVFPKNTEDIKQLVKWAKKRHATGDMVSLTARSAGTDMSGGPLNDSIIVLFTTYFNHIKEIKTLSSDSTQGDQTHTNILENVGMSHDYSQGGYAIVEPGVYFRDFEKELDAWGLLFPPYPASKDLCALGGMINNNSGGEKTLEYGKTENYVETLKIVLSDGEEHELKPISADELQQKIKEESFEGDLYRRLYELIEKNYDEIQKAKPDVSKNSAGYALWNVWDKKTFNLVKLIVGSQGTLGLVTEAKLRLVKKKKYSKMIVIFAKNLNPIPKLAQALLSFAPESIESYDDKTLNLALKFFFPLVRMMKGNILKLAWDFLPEFLMVLKGGFPKMVLLIQFSGNDEGELNKRVITAVEAAKKFPVQIRIIKDKDEESKYWTIRRQSFNLLHTYIKDKYAAPFVDDIIVKPEYMSEVLPKVNAILDRYKNKLIYTIAGHPGNGNFHIIPLVDLKDPETPKIIKAAMDEVYTLVLKYGGSLTAEHNDGLIRSPYLEMMYGEKICKLFKEVKNIFDPLNIFNPGKKVRSEWQYSLEHIKR